MNEPIDFDEVRRNAANDGIALSEICILYENLTPEEFETIDQRGLITHVLEKNKGLMAKFASDGSVLFPEKAVGVHTLAS